MHRSLRFVPALLLGPLVGCQDQSLSPAAGHAGPSFATTASAPACPTSPTVTVTDEPALRAAIVAAQPGDMIAVSGTIVVTADDTIATDNVTLTCATPGSGLVATGFDVLDMVTVAARGVVVDGLVLDGSQAGDSPYLALNDGVSALAQDVRFTNNTVTCARFGECVFIVGGTGAVVSDNQFQATDAFSGIHMQANGPDPTVFLPIRIDGARVERNTIVAITPSFGLRFGAIRVFDADNVMIADNVVSGPWRNGFSPFRLANSQIQRNQITGPGSQAGDSPYLALNDGVSALAQDVMRPTSASCSTIPPVRTSSPASRTPWWWTTGPSTATTMAAPTRTSSRAA